MEDKFLKSYVYLLIIFAIANLLSFTLFLLFRNSFLKIILVLISSLESLVLIGSIGFIVYVMIKKIDKIQLVLPIFYLVGFLVIGVVGAIFALKSGDMFDFSYLPNILSWIASGIFYLFQITFGTYLLKKKSKSFQKKEQHGPKNKSNTLGVVSVLFGILSLVPLVGIPSSIIAIVTGIMDIKKNKSRLGKIGLVLGILGLLITIVLYGGLFYLGFVQRGGIYDDLRIKLVKDQQLPQLVNAIEVYKVRFGEYPETITKLERINPESLLFDPIQEFNNMFSKEKEDNYFYYEQKGDTYFLFSKGVDGKPFTEDDVYPEFELKPDNLGYRTPEKNNSN